jgi:integrase
MANKQGRDRRGRADNNEGSIYQSEDGTWHARVIVGYTPEGKPVRKHRQAQTQKEIKRKFQELLRERDERVPAEGRKKTLVSDLLRSYLEFLDASKPNTRMHYDEKNYVKNRLNPAFGAIPAKSLDISDMERVYQEWLTDPVKPMAPSTVRRIHAILSGAYTYAMKHRRVSHDPTKYVDLPRDAHGDGIEAFTADEIRRILDQARDRFDDGAGHGRTISPGRGCAGRP